MRWWGGNSEHIAPLLWGGSGPHFSCSSEAVPPLFAVSPLYQKTNTYASPLKNPKQNKPHAEVEALTSQHPRPGASPLRSPPLPPCRLRGSLQAGPDPSSQSCQLAHALASVLHRASSSYSWALGSRLLRKIAELLFLTLFCNYFIQVGSLQSPALWMDKSLHSLQCWSRTEVQTPDENAGEMTNNQSGWKHSN